MSLLSSLSEKAYEYNALHLGLEEDITIIKTYDKEEFINKVYDYIKSDLRVYPKVLEKYSDDFSNPNVINGNEYVLLESSLRKVIEKYHYNEHDNILKDLGIRIYKKEPTWSII